jgi:hypothetical protein
MGMVDWKKQVSPPNSFLRIVFDIDIVFLQRFLKLMP